MVTVLGTEEALETSKVLFLELGGGGDVLPFFLLFLLVTRVKVTSSTSGASVTISISGEGVRIEIVLIASTKVGVLGWGEILK